MRREIKFRAKDSDWNLVYWHYFHIPENNLMLKWHFIIVQKKKWFEQILIDITTLWQYTWLKDKNWIEIYEGDVIEWSLLKWEIIFENACFYMRDIIVKMRTPLFNINVWNIEVIWNIYENPILNNS